MKWSGDVRRYIDPSVYRHLGYLRVNSFLCFFFSRNRNRQIALKVQPLGGAAWVVPVVPEPGWIQGLCQEGRLTKKTKANIRSGAPRREQPEGLCAWTFLWVLCLFVFRLTSEPVWERMWAPARHWETLGWSEQDDGKMFSGWRWTSRAGSFNTSV